MSNDVKERKFAPASCLWNSWARIPREEYQKRMQAHLDGTGELWEECDQLAVYVVGAADAWHLCEEHAADPAFRRMKKVEQWPENRKPVEAVQP